MMTRFRTRVQTRRDGQVLAIAAISMVALLALLSLGIDLGMAYTARSEAQRVADAAALAGASIFMEMPAPLDVAGAADARARDYAARNVVRNRPVHPDDDVMVAVLLNEQKVRVRIERRGLPTWFARLLGQDHLTVSADAAAAVINTGVAKCLKPWAVMDLYHDGGHARPDPPRAYGDGDHYEAAIDDANDPTGWGSETEDFGDKMTIKAQDPKDDAVPEPGVFLPIRLPTDDSQEACDRGGGGNTDAGAATYRQNICSCNKTPISIGQALPIQTGNMVGPTNQGVEELISEDPGAKWVENPAEGDPHIQNSAFTGDASPRIVHMILIGPDQITSSGMQEVTVTNISKFFIEGFEGTGPNKKVVGRFFGPVIGEDDGSGGGTTTSLVKILRLVE